VKELKLLSAETKVLRESLHSVHKDSMKRIPITAQDIRDLVERHVTQTIEIHRASRSLAQGPAYTRPSGESTDEEIDDFISSMPTILDELKEQLIDPGLLGFEHKTATTSINWVPTFEKSVKDWATNTVWLSANLPWFRDHEPVKLQESQIWQIEHQTKPEWIEKSPTALMLAEDILCRGRLLSELPWRTFEELIGQMLESEGWNVAVTRPTKDDGVDVIAHREDPIMGLIKTLWQAKRYGPKRYVRLAEVRELAGIVDIDRATKGMLVTTSRLTSGAIQWIKRDQFRLGYKDGRELEKWVRERVLS